MRYLGIDFGAKRVGLAVSSEDIAFPRGVIPNDASLITALCELIAKEMISGIVVGDTLSFGGHENRITKDTQGFIERLRGETSVPVSPASEVGSSVEAARYAPHGEKHDDAAAALILQRYLDMRAPAVDSDHA